MNALGLKGPVFQHVSRLSLTPKMLRFDRLSRRVRPRVYLASLPHTLHHPLVSLHLEADENVSEYCDRLDGGPTDTPSGLQSYCSE